MSMLSRLFSHRDPADAVIPLYNAIVAGAREPEWYIDGAVADTMDGRFEMVAAILVLVLLRLEDEPTERRTSALLTETFVNDMDGQLRQIGVGDVMVGKHVGKMMGALGGRLGAYRAALADDRPEIALAAALRRNLYGNADVGTQAVDFVVARILALAARLQALPIDALRQGALGPAINSGA